MNKTSSEQTTTVMDNTFSAGTETTIGSVSAAMETGSESILAEHAETSMVDGTVAANVGAASAGAAGSSSTKRLNFPGGMKYFKPVADKIIAMVDKNLAEFAGYKGFYSSGFIADLKSELDTAVNLEDAKGVIAVRAADRILLEGAAAPVRLLWQKTKGYIETCFVQRLWEQRMKEAGWDYYSQRSDWASNSEMCKKAIKFIGDYDTALSANNNMPSNFKADFQRAADKFNQAWTTFNNANDNRVVVKVAKLAACNSVYAKLAAISKDSAKLFRKPEIRQLYTYSYQLAVLRGGSASFKALALDGFGNGIANVSVASKDGKYKGVTNDKGFVKINKIKADTGGADYIFVFGKTGLVPVELPVAFKPSTAKTVKVKMNSIDNG